MLPMASTSLPHSSPEGTDPPREAVGEKGHALRNDTPKEEGVRVIGRVSGRVSARVGSGRMNESERMDKQVSGRMSG